MDTLTLSWLLRCGLRIAAMEAGDNTDKLRH
jgi:hypothetical protein